jgi:DNA-binding beta-propeller fold protein YncE
MASDNSFRKEQAMRSSRLVQTLLVALLVLSTVHTAGAGLVVASSDNNRVLRFNGTTGAFLETLASGPPLDLPIAPIVGPDGDFYVSNLNSSQVLRYDGSTGAYEGVFASGSGQFVGIRFGPDGNLYACSFGPGQIQRFNGTTGAPMGVFATMDSFAQPSGMVFGPDGNLYVTQEDQTPSPDGSVFRFDGTTGQLIDVFVPAGSGGLHIAAGLTFGPDGNLYVTGFETDGVLRYNGSTGAFMDVFASGGGLDAPCDVQFGPDGSLYISSAASDQILRYNGTTGAFMDVFASGNGLDGPCFMVFDGKPDTPLPEPGGAMLVLGASAGLLRRRRRH